MQENEDKLQVQLSQINISHWILMKSKGEAMKQKKKKQQHSSCTFFISDPVNYCGEAARWGTCEPNDLPGRRCKHFESQRVELCIIFLDLSGPGPAWAERGGAG